MEVSFISSGKISKKGKKKLGNGMKSIIKKNQQALKSPLAEVDI